jgi:hypothetical protein
MEAEQERTGSVRLLVRAYFQDDEQGRCVLANTFGRVSRTDVGVESVVPARRS